ncbi:MAG: 30S ribosomal protein S4 [Firmicutes bacterium]|jgi:small subunit ribosomal protein S4|nr:30S ribosomal protein S4 [Bacillota bacterium]NMB12522.1 30S ribosomal protein S4 [Bacillota bacterium]
MARYTGPVCRLCRREGEKLFLKGDRCYTEKCAVDRRTYPPGQHGQGRRKESEYGLHLREKQKVRRIYGVLERQFERYYDRAARQKGITGENLLQLLEMRLDNIVYRMGLGASRAQARQLVLHGHIAVNGKKVDIPSYEVQPGDVISVRENSRNLQLIKDNVEAAAGRTMPEWMEVNLEQMEGKILAVPTRDQIDISVQEHLIVEFYSQ